ncbi:TIGR03086 family metal-binding protein [Streptacidiphilus monticola]|jgi:uncharacterized protein (TIGR03086 family)|uniref:TIGR03086 family metal-binding protein n=1 Tax=Streptacidiphilus monticola TaxID=2161674 RepID=A0ABW1FZT0_9ACTN
MASIELLERALAQTEHLVAAVRPEQGDDPTPCRSWEVGRLISHLVYDLGEFTARASGRDPDWSGGFPDVLPEDWSPAFRSGADLLLHAWRAGGSGLDEERQRFTLSQQAAELAVHDWDLARATAQPTASLDPELATASLAWAQAALQPRFRGPEAEGKVFGTEVPLSVDAPIQDRLAAFFGRDPAWTAAAAS